MYLYMYVYKAVSSAQGKQDFSMNRLHCVNANRKKTNFLNTTTISGYTIFDKFGSYVNSVIQKLD